MNVIKTVQGQIKKRVNPGEDKHLQSISGCAGETTRGGASTTYSSPAQCETIQKIPPALQCDWPGAYYV